MLISKPFLSILRWGLRLHGSAHLIEVVAAISEGAYITASIAFIFISIEILASFFIPNEHIHFKPMMSKVHAKCDEDIHEESEIDHNHLS